MQTCKGRTKTGTACRAPAGAGGLCFFHANPDSAKSLGQIGGRKNRRSVVDLEVPDNMTAADVCKVTGQAIRLVLSGELKAREASALAQLCNSLHRGLQTNVLEARVARLEQQQAEQESLTSVDTDATGSPRQEEGRGGTDAQPGDVYTPASGDEADGRNDGPGEGGEA